MYLHVLDCGFALVVLTNVCLFTETDVLWTFDDLQFSPHQSFVQVIDKSFGFDTAVEEAQRAINAAHVEVESVENGVGIVKLMGRYSGMIT